MFLTSQSALVQNFTSKYHVDCFIQFFQTSVIVVKCTHENES